MYSKIVEEILQMTKIQHGATLECIGEACTKSQFSCSNDYFSTKQYRDKDCHEAMSIL